MLHVNIELINNNLGNALILCEAVGGIFSPTSLRTGQTDDGLILLIVDPKFVKSFLQRLEKKKISSKILAVQITEQTSQIFQSQKRITS